MKVSWYNSGECGVNDGDRMELVSEKGVRKSGEKVLGKYNIWKYINDLRLRYISRRGVK